MNPEIEFCWKLITTLVSSREQQRDDLLENQLEPLYEKITAIHKDYMTTFSSFARAIRNGEIDNEGIRNYLEERQLNMAAERTLARALGKALKKSTIGPGVRRFGEAVAFYFSSPYQTVTNPMSTYFSSLLDGEESALQIRPDYESNEALLLRLDTITKYILPKRFAELSSCYANICIHREF